MAPLHLFALLNPTSFVTTSGYLAIFLLSVLQSCCVPTSSELTLGIAGALAAEGKLSLAGAIAAGALGEVVGAYIAWFIGRSGGAPLSTVSAATFCSVTATSTGPRPGTTATTVGVSSVAAYCRWSAISPPFPPGWPRCPSSASGC